VDSALESFLTEEGYTDLRTLPTGKIAGLHQMMFTYGLYVGLGFALWEKRYCYEHESDALTALLAWDGNGDPPGPWIKEKPSDRLGPGATEGIRRG
jgi:hypothetical protein